MMRIRKILGQFIGKTVADVTENDRDEPARYVMFQFTDGTYVRFTVDGVEIGPVHGVTKKVGD